MLISFLKVLKLDTHAQQNLPLPGIVPFAEEKMKALDRSARLSVILLVTGGPGRVPRWSGH